MNFVLASGQKEKENKEMERKYFRKQ